MISINRLNLTSKKRNLENQNVSWWINFVLNSDFEFSFTNKNTTHHTSFDKSLISFRNGDVYCDWNCNLFHKDDVFCDWNCIALQRWCVLRLKLYRSTKMVCFATELYHSTRMMRFATELYHSTKMMRFAAELYRSTKMMRFATETLFFFKVLLMCSNFCLQAPSSRSSSWNVSYVSWFQFSRPSYYPAVKVRPNLLFVEVHLVWNYWRG